MKAWATGFSWVDLAGMAEGGGVCLDLLILPAVVGTTRPADRKTAVSGGTNHPESLNAAWARCRELKATTSPWCRKASKNP